MDALLCLLSRLLPDKSLFRYLFQIRVYDRNFLKNLLFFVDFLKKNWYSYTYCCVKSGNRQISLPRESSGPPAKAFD